jgi:hypothetical protein
MKKILCLSFILITCLPAYPQVSNPPLGIQDENDSVLRPISILQCVGDSISCEKVGLKGVITVSGSTGINWAELDADIFSAGINWADVELNTPITEAMINDLGSYLTTETDPEWSAWDGSTGINWSAMPLLTSSNINWTGIDEAVITGINWDDYDNSSINWAAIDEAVLTGINWEAYENVDVNWAAVDEAVLTGINWTDYENVDINWAAIDEAVLTGVNWAAYEGGSGASSFIELSDVPASYDGQGLKYLRVNTEEDAIEFTSSSGTTNWNAIDSPDGNQSLDLATYTTTWTGVGDYVFSDFASFSTELPVEFVGSEYTTTLSWADGSQDNTITLPDESGTVCTTGAVCSGYQASGSYLNAYPAAGISISTGSAWGTSLTAPSGAVVGTTDAQTLTNKRVTSRVVSTASTTSWTIDADSYDMAQQTALAGTLTVNEPSGTPVNGQRLIIRIKDDGTAREINWNAVFRASSDLALPTTTVMNKTMYLGFIYNEAATKWDCVAFLNNF